MKYFVIFVVILSATGCSSFGRKLKSFLGGKNSTTATVASAGSQTKYSDSSNVYTGVRRNYKRATRQSLEEEALLSNRSGSLWVMEGQGAYLFSQNIVRMVGDPIAVTIEGEPKEQLSSKVGIISKLWAKYEERTRIRAPAAEAKPGQATKDSKVTITEPDSEAAKPAPVQQKPMLEDFNVRNVPTRIVERTPDGNYRVKGTQPFMIGTREYKVIVTGVVRAEDFNDEGISATRLLDAKYDVVSARRQEGM